MYLGAGSTCTWVLYSWVLYSWVLYSWVLYSCILYSSYTVYSYTAAIQYTSSTASLLGTILRSWTQSWSSTRNRRDNPAEMKLATVARWASGGLNNMRSQVHMDTTVVRSYTSRMWIFFNVKVRNVKVECKSADQRVRGAECLAAPKRMKILGNRPSSDHTHYHTTTDALVASRNAGPHSRASGRGTSHTRGRLHVTHDVTSHRRRRPLG